MTPENEIKKGLLYCCARQCPESVVQNGDLTDGEICRVNMFFIMLERKGCPIYQNPLDERINPWKKIVTESYSRSSQKRKES
jgi:hypothetical protein